MNDRKKLIELLHVGVCNYDCEECKYSISDDVCINHLEEMAADHLLANGVTVQRWIPVTERLPEKDGIYLTFNKKKQYEFHMFQAGKRMWQGIWEADGVTHWMDLPEPPNEDE